MCPHGSVRTKIFSLWFNNANHDSGNFTKGSQTVVEEKHSIHNEGAGKPLLLFALVRFFCFGNYWYN